MDRRYLLPTICIRLHLHPHWYLRGDGVGDPRGLVVGKPFVIAAMAMGDHHSSELELSIRGRAVYAPRMVAISQKELSITPSRPIHAGSTHLVTGGTGGIGLLTAQWLVGMADRLHLVMVSRRAHVSASAMGNLLACKSATVSVHACDVTQLTEQRALCAMMQVLLPPLHAV